MLDARLRGTDPRDVSCFVGLGAIWNERTRADASQRGTATTGGTRMMFDLVAAIEETFAGAVYYMSTGGAATFDVTKGEMTGMSETDATRMRLVGEGWAKAGDEIEHPTGT